MKPKFETFVSYLGPPTSAEALNDYLMFCDDNATSSYDVYCENHHVLPCSVVKNNYTR